MSVDFKGNTSLPQKQKRYVRLGGLAVDTGPARRRAGENSQISAEELDI